MKHITLKKLILLFPFFLYPLLIVYLYFTYKTRSSQFDFITEMTLFTPFYLVGCIIYYIGFTALDAIVKTFQNNSQTIFYKLFVLISLIMLLTGLFNLTFNYDYTVKMISIISMIASLLLAWINDRFIKIRN